MQPSQIAAIMDTDLKTVRGWLGERKQTTTTAAPGPEFDGVLASAASGAVEAVYALREMIANVEVSAGVRRAAATALLSGYAALKRCEPPPTGPGLTGPSSLVGLADLIRQLPAGMRAQLFADVSDSE
jgi:hypothetical protein